MLCAVPLTRAELAVSAEWHGREYTTDPPRYVPFTVWSLRFELSCEVPIRVAHLFTLDGTVCWGMCDGDEIERSISLGARFHPTDWLRSDEVHLTFASGYGAYVTDPALKADPRPLVEVANLQAATGEVTELAAMPRHGIALAAIAFARDDTETRRLQRWRVRPRLKPQLPEHLHGLVSGRQSGEITR
jgi:hypothetical protein